MVIKTQVSQYQLKSCSPAAVTALRPVRLVQHPTGEELNSVLGILELQNPEMLCVNTALTRILEINRGRGSSTSTRCDEIVLLASCA